MIGRQRQLLDKSLRQGEGAGDPKDGGAQGLAGQQGKLRSDLDRLLKGLGGRKLPGSDRLGDAGHAMGDAQNSLGQQDFSGAEQAQKNALDALEKGAGQLAQELMKEGGQGNNQDQQGQDPLGRAEGTNGSAGGNVKLPDASTLARPREILRELRCRAAEPDRFKQELDYIDRLLREFQMIRACGCEPDLFWDFGWNEQRRRNGRFSVEQRNGSPRRTPWLSIHSLPVAPASPCVHISALERNARCAVS